jgi:hypothetical protein
VTKYLTYNLKDEGFILTHGCRGFSPSRWGGQSMVEHSSSHHGIQEAEREKSCALGLSLLPLFISSGLPAYGMVPLNSGKVFPPWLIVSGNALTDTPRGVLY